MKTDNDQSAIIADLTNRLSIAESALAKITALSAKAAARGQRLSLKSFSTLAPQDRMDFVKSGGKLTD